jgi:hypothetical protein
MNDNITLETNILKRLIMINDFQTDDISLVDVIMDFIFELTKAAVKEQIEKTSNFTVGFCSKYRGSAKFHPDIAASYGLKITHVDGDDEEYQVLIECNGYLGEELSALGYDKDFYLTIDNMDGKSWYSFSNEFEINYQFRGVQIFKRGCGKENILDFENVIENLNKAIFMQKLVS